MHTPTPLRTNTHTHTHTATVQYYSVGEIAPRANNTKSTLFDLCKCGRLWQVTALLFNSSLTLNGAPLSKKSLISKKQCAHIKGNQILMSNMNSKLDNLTYAVMPDIVAIWSRATLLFSNFR